MTKKDVIKILKEEAGAGSIGTRRNGNIMLRWGFFYRHGCDADKKKYKVECILTAHDIPFKIADSGEKWASFRGGASLANSSHWYVEIELLEEVW